MLNIKTYLVKVIIDGQEEELKNFGESESRDFTVAPVSTNETILICNIYNCKYSHD